MNNRDIIRAEAELDMLKDKARETDMLAKENLELRRKINKAIEWCETCYCEITNAIGEKRKMISSENIIDILKGADKE